MCRSNLCDDFACRWTGFNSPLRQFFLSFFPFLAVLFLLFNYIFYLLACFPLFMHTAGPFTASRGVVINVFLYSLTLKRTNSLRVERLQRGINKKFCSNSVQSNHSGNKSLINRCVIGCFPFTWANRSVHGLGKWYTKFRTGKFRPGFAFKHCTNQFH